MTRRIELRPGTYRDSVTLMEISQAVATAPGVTAAIVAMATPIAHQGTTAGAKAQTYPERPIRLVVGGPAGGAVDLSARLLGESLGALRGQPVVIGNKQRTGHDETCVALEVIGDVKGKNVLLVDDFTITGGTLIAMAEILKQRGALDIYAAVSHGVLSKGASSRIAHSLIRQMFMCDTIENRSEPLPPNMTVVSVAPLFAQAIDPRLPADSRLHLATFFAEQSLERQAYKLFIVDD